MLARAFFMRMSSRKEQQPSTHTAVSSASFSRSKSTKSSVTPTIIVPGAIAVVNASSKNRKDAANPSAASIRITIHAKPGAKQNGVTHIDDENVGIQIAAPPRYISLQGLCSSI
jgi:hypothetical protein